MITAPNSDLNVANGQTDRRTLLWQEHGITALREASHGKNQIAHVAGKHHMGRQIIFEEFHSDRDT